MGLIGVLPVLSEPFVVRELVREDVQSAEGRRIEPAVGLVAVCLDPVRGPENSAPPPLMAAIDIAARPAIYYRQKIRLLCSKKSLTDKHLPGTRSGDTRRSHVYKS
jgi:hypothetical protein